MGKVERKVKTQANRQVGIPLKEQSKEDLKKMLILKADELALKKYSDESLDKEKDKQLAKEYRVYNPYKRYINDVIKPYLSKFPPKFYLEIYRLKNWPITNKSLYRRPRIVAKWTNDLIYCRYPNGILQTLQVMNPYISNGIREHKHFQFLTDLAETELRQFIKDATDTMGESSYWSQFKRLHAQKYNLPYQADLFDK